jgi:hypothetical protein
MPETYLQYPAEIVNQRKDGGLLYVSGKIGGESSSYKTIILNNYILISSYEKNHPSGGLYSFRRFAN